MHIEVESLGQRLRDFHVVKDELRKQNRQFDAQTLRLIPYAQLHLCCIGNAGEAACTVTLVREEKKARRERFLSMQPEELKAAEMFLKVEQMYDDVMHDIYYRNAPKWGDLTDRQKIWAKLTCLCNHPQLPHARLAELDVLLQKCVAAKTLPSEACMGFMQKLKNLAATYPGSITDTEFRNRVVVIIESLFAFLSKEERLALEREQLQDFTCTSDCFRVLVP